MKVLFTAINAKFPHTNIAVRYFYYLSKQYNNIDGEFCEYTINNQKDIILQELIEKNVDVICFSCYIWNINIITDLCRCIRQVAPNIKLILGGPEVSFAENANSYFCDYIVSGEGEIALFELLTSIDGGLAPKERIIKCDRPFDINLLPFPYQNELSSLNNRTLYYEASRGCPYKCAYCLSGSEHGIRFKSVEKIKSELQIFIDAGVRQVKFTDRTFNCDKKVCKEIWRFITDNYNGVTNFHFEVSADIIDEEMLDILKKMPKGLVQLEVGVQSTNPETLRAIRRYAKLDKIFDKVDIINGFGNIHLHLDLIAGLPFEDISSFRRSFNEVFAHKPQQLQLGMLKLLKGSYMYSVYNNYAMKFRHYAPYEILETDVLPYRDVIKLKKVEEVVELYYNSGRFESMVYYLLSFYDTPFDFFFDLGHYYVECGHHIAPLSKDNQYNFLYDFSVEKLKNIDYDLFANLCRYDIVRHERPRKIPHWAKAKKYLTKYETTELLTDENIQKYLPQYIGKDIDEVLNSVYIELFDYDVESEDKEKRDIALLFDYNDRSILGRAKSTKIKY